MCAVMRRLLPIALVVAIGGDCWSQIQFVDVIPTTGITWFQQDSGQQVSGAVAFLDYDLDGWQDIFLAGGINAPGLYRNNGNGTFQLQSVAAGLHILPIGFEICSVAAADYDNDGDTDLFMACNGPDRLYRNNANGTFTNVTAASGLGASDYGVSASFGDYDRDGDLDLYVGNYIQTFNFPNHAPTPNILYRNNGNGTFTDVTAQTGVAGAGTTFSAAWSDYDRDGDPDLFVLNDFGNTIQGNQLYRNDGLGVGGWQFTEVSAALGVNQGIFSMGVAAADYDRDGDLDYTIGNIGPNLFLRNDGLAGFAEIAGTNGTQFAMHPYQPTLTTVTWGVGFQDFDQDGWLDLFLANGFVTTGSLLSNPTLQPNALLHHQGASLQYTNIGASAGVEHLGLARGTAYGDYDRDGDVDILVGNVGGPPLLYRNDSVGIGHRIQFVPRGVISNRDGFGTWAEVTLPGGDILAKELAPDISFLSTDERAFHFGVGTATLLPRVELFWPSGIRQRVHDVPVDVAGVVPEPMVTAAPNTSAPSTVQQGQVLGLNLILQNHDGQARTVTHELVASAGPIRIPFGTVTSTVPATGTLSVPMSIPIPAGLLPPGQSVDVTLTWTVLDGLGSIDQWRQVTTIQS